MADKLVAWAAITTMIARVVGRQLAAAAEYFLDLQVTLRLLVGHELPTVEAAAAVKLVDMAARVMAAAEAAGEQLVVTTLT